jgi:hypothetical protein
MNETVNDLKRTRREASHKAFDHLKQFKHDDCETTVGNIIQRMLPVDRGLFIEFTDGTHIFFECSCGGGDYDEDVGVSIIDILPAHALGILPPKLVREYIDAQNAEGAAVRHAQRRSDSNTALRKSLKDFSRDEVLAILDEETK